MELHTISVLLSPSHSLSLSLPPCLPLPLNGSESIRDEGLMGIRYKSEGGHVHTGGESQLLQKQRCVRCVAKFVLAAL